MVWMSGFPTTLPLSFLIIPTVGMPDSSLPPPFRVACLASKIVPVASRLPLSAGENRYNQSPDPSAGSARLKCSTSESEIIGRAGKVLNTEKILSRSATLPQATSPMTKGCINTRLALSRCSRAFSLPRKYSIHTEVSVRIISETAASDRLEVRLASAHLGELPCAFFFHKGFQSSSDQLRL